MAIHGYGPNGRALKKDGTERKARKTLSPAEKIAQIQEMERRAYGSIGRKILAAADTFRAFNSGLATFKKWVRDCRAYSDAEKREARRAYFQAQIDAIDAKGEIAENWLPGADSAIKVISDLHSSIGEGYQALVKDGNATPENIAAMISEHLSDEVRQIVESANDPDSDPYADYRRGSNSDENSDEDSDTL